MLYVLSATYDSKLNALTLKLYNDVTEKIEEWTDAEYKPYFLSEKRIENLNGICNQTLIEKYDALHDKNIDLWKVEMENPALAKQTEEMEGTYEHLRFFLSYIYDKNIKMGMPYKREGIKLVFEEDPTIVSVIDDIVNKFDITLEEKEIYKMWAELMEYPAPNFKRAAVDIEVWNEEGENKVPVVTQALNPVTSICFATLNGERIALVLIRENMKFESIPPNVDRLEFFSSEKLMLERAFEIIDEYPMILTFNGDTFDFPYMYYRALRFDISKEKIPFEIRTNVAMLRNGVHIDLYKFFFLRAMQTYAFGSKYKNVSLEEVSQALLNKGKIKSDKKFNELTYYELMHYCMNDAELTLELSTYNDNIVINLITMVQRISRLPIENSSRKNVGAWIKNFMTYEHRRRNHLIPSKNTIRTLKNVTASTALIKGKKYKGAIVFEPKSGIHFKVLVLDFASLYPSIIKRYNIGYATINCPHEECKSNTIGELNHWICKKKRAMESLLIGSLRDLRVDVYKKKAKDKNLSQALRNWYKVAEQSIKVIMNASYGVFGNEEFDFYCPPEAEEIAAIARFVTSSTAKKSESEGLIVLYGDTDSIFIKDPNQEQLKDIIEWTKNEFGIEFEVDKTYRYACLSGRKKNYFGVFTDGTVDVKGLTGKKKHTPKIIKNGFEGIKKILTEINTEEEMNEKKLEIIELSKEIAKTIKKREWKDITDIAFNVTMSKEANKYESNIPQHVRAAKMLEEEGYTITANDNIKYVKILRKETVTSAKTGKKSVKMVNDIKPIELATKEEIDVDKYIEFLKSTFAQILDPMEVDFDEKVLGISKLKSWME